MPIWSPAVWDDFSTVGLALFIVALLIVSLIRGWIVLGRYHREIVDSKDRENAALNARSAKDAESIATLSQAITAKNATEDATTRILSAIRETVSGGP